MLCNGPFWMLAGAVLVLFFLPLGPFWFQWAVVDLHWGRFGRCAFVCVSFYLRDNSLEITKCNSVYKQSRHCDHAVYLSVFSSIREITHSRRSQDVTLQVMLCGSIMKTYMDGDWTWWSRARRDHIEVVKFWCSSHSGRESTIAFPFSLTLQYGALFTAGACRVVSPS